MQNQPAFLDMQNSVPNLCPNRISDCTRATISWVSNVPSICRLAQSRMHSRTLQQRLHSAFRLACAGGEQPQLEEPLSRLRQRAAPMTARCCLNSAHRWQLVCTGAQPPLKYDPS